MDYAILIAALSFVLSVIALIISFTTSIKSNSIAMGEIELSVHETISNSQARVSQITTDMLPLLYKADKSEGEQKQLEVYKKVLAQAVEDNLNSYDQACGKYLDT